MRGFLAIVAGLVTIYALVTLFAHLLPMMLSGMSVNGAAMVLCVAAFVAEVAGGFVTARVTLAKPFFHAFVVGAIWLLVVIIQAKATWATTSVAFHAVEIMLAVPMVLLGARLASGRSVAVTA